MQFIKKKKRQLREEIIMALLDENMVNQLKEVFKRIDKEIKIVNFVSESNDKSKELQSFLSPCFQEQRMTFQVRRFPSQDKIRRRRTQKSPQPRRP